MDRSRFLAGLIGPTAIAVAVGVLINRQILTELAPQLSGDYALILIVGIMTLVAGLAIVLSHNVWRGWPAAVTAFGWLAIAGGLVRILFPRQIAEMAPAFVAQSWSVPVVAALVALFGLFLSWKAFRP